MALCHKLDYQAVVRWSMEEPARRNSLAVIIGNTCNKRVENFNHEAQTFCLKAEKQKLITSVLTEAGNSTAPNLLTSQQMAGRQFTLFRLYQRKRIQFIVWYFDRPPYNTFGRSLFQAVFATQSLSTLENLASKVGWFDGVSDQFVRLASLV